MLNKSKGNMYTWVTHTWNPIRGKCPHECIYCYMKGYPQPELHLDEKTLKDNLGSGNTIFVGSSTDMWADTVPKDWIGQVLNRCCQFDNTYLFQTKNPSRIALWDCYGYTLPGLYGAKGKTIIGTTIETNKDMNISKAPAPVQRYEWMSEMRGWLPLMISIEPILDFDLDIMVKWIRDIKSEFVSIGADSKGHNLPEPSPEKIDQLMKTLQAFTRVGAKDNLKRLLVPQK